MAGPSGRSIRPPAVAGMFYPADPGTCRALASRYVKDVSFDAGGTRMFGAIVPHAGWMCSGAIAGKAIAALARAAGDVDLVVVFGAIHTPARVEYAALDVHEAWSVPGDEIDVAPDVASRLAEKTHLFAGDERLHRREHAVEVELPLIRVAWPAARVLPVETPVNDSAVAIGESVARLSEQLGLRAVFLASSDLTHYGPEYDFTPAGVGPGGLAWARENDRRILSIVQAMRAESVVPEAKANQNACGGGAIAAMLSACRYFGASRAEVLWHTNSYEMLASVAPQPPVDAVGYAAVVVK